MYGRSQDALPTVAEGQLDSPGVVAVTKRVYASPSRTPVHLGSSKSGAHSEPEPSYPEICFAIDNFDDAFEDVVGGGGCVCVW